jgi:hypothetical protein
LTSALGGVESGRAKEREVIPRHKRAALQNWAYLVAVVGLGLAILGMGAFLIWTVVAPAQGATRPLAESAEPGAGLPPAQTATSPSSSGAVEPPVGALPDSLEPTAELPILHVKRTIHGLNAGPEAEDRSPITEERWLDTETGNGRSVIMRQDGTVRSIGVVNGNTHSTYAYWDNYLNSDVYPEGAPELDAMKWDLWSYREGLSDPQAQIKGTGVVRGRQAIELEGILAGESSGTINIFLDDATKLPITKVYNEEGSGGSVTTRRIDYEYLLVELLPAQALTPEMLEVPAPPDANKDIDRQMTLAEAQAFEEYDIYYLGETFENLTLTEIYDYRGRSSIVPEIRRVEFLYHNLAAYPAEHLYVTNEPVDLSLFGAVEGGEEVSVGDHQGWWYQSLGHLQVKLGDTAVTISGERDQVLRAANALTRVNE